MQYRKVVKTKEGQNLHSLTWELSPEQMGEVGAIIEPLRLA